MRFAQHCDFLPVDHEGLTLGVHLSREASVGGIVFQQVGKGFRIREIIDGADLDPSTGEGRFEDKTADSAKAVDGDSGFFHRRNRKRNGAKKTPAVPHSMTERGSRLSVRGS